MVGKALVVWLCHFQLKKAKIATIHLMKMQHGMSRQNICHRDDFQLQTEICSFFFFFFKAYKTLSFFTTLMPVTD